jgi:ferric-dicitrate binding protein FerR (iron transport regulator)
VNDPKLQELIQGWLAGTLDETQRRALEGRLLRDPEARRAFREAASLDSGMRDWAAGAGSLAAWSPPESTPAKRGFAQIVSALGLAAAVVLVAAWWTSRETATLARPERSESTDRGCAILTQAIDAAWATPGGSKPGEMLSRGTVSLAKGVVQIEFFSGAALMLEGPAELEIVSSWEAVCRQGKARVRVPPSARGFKLRTPDITLVDLGTEFGAEVNGAAGGSRVQVFDGEVGRSAAGTRHSISSAETGWKSVTARCVALRRCARTNSSTAAGCKASRAPAPARATPHGRTFPAPSAAIHG